MLSNLVKSPYLVQRAKINRPIADLSTRLSQAVNMDYMGSSEFEWGALPNSFRALQQKEKLVLRKVPGVMEGEACLRVFSGLTDAEFADYELFLVEMRNSPLYVWNAKERLEFEAEFKPFVHRDGSVDRTDFWWDLDNHAMFGFDKNFMNRVSDYVAASLKFMDEQKAARAAK